MFNLNQTNEAARLVCTFHYSGRMPANVQVCATKHVPGGLFGDAGDAVAACLFSIPPTRWDVPVLELSRLVRDETWSEPLTPLISWACKKAKASGWGLVVSFADWTQSHHGGIYQAASWNYHAMRIAGIDGVLIDGVFIPGRSCNSKYGTRSPDLLRKAMPGRDIQPHFDAGKHCYWRALTKDGKRQAQAAGLTASPYPKPGRLSRS